MALRKELVIANIFLLNVILGAGLSTSLLSVYLKSIGLSLGNVGLIYAFGAILAGFLRLPIGTAVDCVGKRNFVIFGAIGFPLFAIGITFAKTVPQFIGLDILLELFAAVCWTAFSAHYFDILSKGKEGVEMAQRNLFYYSASAAAPLLAGIIADRLGFTTLFYISALISVIGIPIAAAGIKDHDRVKGSVCFKDFGHEYSDILKIKGYKTIFAVLFVNSLTWTFWAIYMPIFLNNSGFNFSQIGLVMTAVLVSGAIIQLPLGKIIDKYPAKWILIPGFALVFLGGWMFFAFKNYFTYLAGRVVAGLGWDLGYWPATGLFAKVTPREEHGGAWAALMAGSGIAYGIGALTGGFLTERYGISKVLFASAFAAFLFSIALISSKVLAGKAQKHYKRHHFIHHTIRHRTK